MSVRRAAGPAAIMLVVAACGARTGLGAPIREDASVADAHHPHDAALDALDASDEPDVVPSPLCADVDASFPKSECSVSVRVGFITPSSPTCYVDLLVHEGDQGAVTYACNDPSDFATGVFPGGTFPGSVSGTTVNLCSGTTFQWSDGCTWASAQRIYGDVTSGTLTFTYDEQPIQGTGCEPPCTASGTVIVQ